MAKLGLTSQPAPFITRGCSVCPKYVDRLRLQEGDPSVPGGTKHPGLPCTLPGPTTPGPGPDEKGPGDLERTPFSVCSVRALSWGSDLASLGAFRSQALAGSPSPEVSPGVPCDWEPSRLVREGCEQGQLCLPTCKQLRPLAPQSGPTWQHIWAFSGFAPLDRMWLQYLQDLPLKRRVLESCFLVQF